MGKSTVSKWFQELGVPVDDADAVVHKLYAAGGGAVAPVRELFGAEVIGDDGGISRPLLSKFVVGEANAANLNKLESVVFPLVDAAREAFVQGASDKGEPLVVLDIPLLFERSSEKLCDVVLVVSAPANLQRERVLARAGMTEAKFIGILNRQVPDAEKRTRADHVLDTGAAPEDTRAAVVAFVDDCRQRVLAERRTRQLRQLGIVVIVIGTALLGGLVAQRNLRLRRLR